MTGLHPSRTGGFPVELETAAPTQAAVTRTGTFEGRLGRPCEGALFVGKQGEPGDDLVNSEEGGEKALLWSPIIRRCMFILHDRVKQRARRQYGKQRTGRANIAPLLPTCELAAFRARRQEMKETMMRSPGG